MRGNKRKITEKDVKAAAGNELNGLEAALVMRCDIPPHFQPGCKMKLSIELN